MNKSLSRFSSPIANNLGTSSPRSDLFHSFNTILDDFFNVSLLGLSPVQTDLGYPKFNAYRKKITSFTLSQDKGKEIPAICIELFVPYVKKEDVEIEANEVANTLTISAKSHQDENVADTDYYVRQLSRSAFKRTFVFDKEYPVNKADADLKDGILHITITSTVPSKPETKKIKIG